MQVSTEMRRNAITYRMILGSERSGGGGGTVSSIAAPSTSIVAHYTQTSEVLLPFVANDFSFFPIPAATAVLLNSMVATSPSWKLTHSLVEPQLYTFRATVEYTENSALELFVFASVIQRGTAAIDAEFTANALPTATTGRMRINLEGEAVLRQNDSLFFELRASNKTASTVNLPLKFSEIIVLQ